MGAVAPIEIFGNLLTRTFLHPKNQISKMSMGAVAPMDNFGNLLSRWVPRVASDYKSNFGRKRRNNNNRMLGL